MFLNVIYNLFIMPLELIFEIVFSVANKIVANPALSIIALSLVMNFLVLPLYKRADAMQEQERDKVNSMAKWVNHIKKTFKGDERYMMLTTYYRQQNYKPIYALRSSLSLILQIPFFIAAYHYLSNLPLLNGASFLFLSNLGAPDQLLTIGSISINIMPIIMTLINFASAFIYLKGFPIKDKVQTYGIGVIFLILLYNSPSGLVFYWTLNQIFSMLKNVFMKLVKSRKVLNIVFSVVGILFLIAMIVLGKCEATDKTLVIVLVAFICQLPTIISFINKRKKQSTKEFVPTKYILFLLGGILLTLLLGVLIPLSVISSSPLEFVTTSFTPSTIIIKNVSIAAGFFLVWFNVFYYLANPKGRTVFTYIVWALSGVAILDYMFFGKNLGTISTYLMFDALPSFSTNEKLLNTGLVIVVVVAFCLLMHFARKIIPYCYLILIVGIMALSIVNISKVSSTIKAAPKEEKINEYEPIIHLSKTGQNVVVILLDRAISAYIPFIMNEKPELMEVYDGFTYYPNTISFGLNTNICTPSLFGGYKYTPDQIEARSNERLVDKHNAALKTIPTLLSNVGYKGSVINMPYANYKEPGDLSIFDDLENVAAYNIRDEYLPHETVERFCPNIEKLEERNFFMYSVFKISPVLFQPTIYNRGEYFSTSQKFLISEGFLSHYSILEAMPRITEFTEDNNNFLIMDNETTHEPVLLKTPEYEPSLEPTSKIEGNKIVLGDITMKMKTKLQIAHYQTNMAALIKVGEWLKYLKENGAYDNSRIIIVGDHGRLLSQFDHLDMEIVDAQGYNPTLLVKDFNSKGFTIDNSFRTIADVVSIATNNIVDYENKKNQDKQFITTSGNFAISINDGYTLNIGDGRWLSVHDNIFDKNNWEEVSP